MITHRFGDEANISRPVQFGLDYVINCSGSVTNLKSSSLNPSNCSRANYNLKRAHILRTYIETMKI